MGSMDVVSAAWIVAAPSKVPFYVAGGLLAGWAVLLAASGITHPDFPGSPARARLVMLTSALLVGTTVGTAVATGGGEEEGGGEPATEAQQPARALAFTADPSGQPAYQDAPTSAQAGAVTVRFVNRSPAPHDVTLTRDGRKVAQTKIVQGATAETRADLQPGGYVFFCSVPGHREAGMEGRLTVR